MTETILELRNIDKSFGPTKVIDGLNLSIAKGEVFSLLGPSGCGKSTTLRIIAGLEEPDAGQVVYNGKPWVDIDKDTKRDVFLAPHQRNVGVVFQNYAIWPHMTVFENVAYPLRIRRVTKKIIAEKVKEALSLVGLEHLQDRPAPMLSGGQQQRVAFARALVYEPNILLLDEPFSNLDANLREKMRLEVKQLQEKLNLSIILVTHDHLDAFTLSDCIGIMNNGRIEQIDNNIEMYENPNTPFVRDFVGRTVILNGVIMENNDHNCVVRLTNNIDLNLKNKNYAAGDIKPGHRVAVSFRPEDIKIEPDWETRDIDANCVECTIDQAIFLGARFECLIRLDDYHVITTYMDRDHYPKAKDRVVLRFNPNKARIWAG